MKRMSIKELFQYVKSMSDQGRFGFTGECPVYSFGKGERLFTDYPSLKGNGILISMNDFPQLRIVQGYFDIMPDCLFLRIKDEYSADHRYVYYYLMANLVSLRKYYGGTVNKRLQISEFLDIEITLPAITEQKRIVEIMSAVDAAKGNREGQILAFKGFLYGYYTRITDGLSSKYWNKCKIGDILSNSDGIRTVRNMKMKPDGDDVILTNKGRAYLYSSSLLSKSTGNNDYCISIDKKRCNPHYLVAVLNNDKDVIVQMMVSKSSRGYVLASKAALENIEIRLPIIEQQDDIANVIKTYETICLKMQPLDESMNKLRQGLLWRIFHKSDGNINESLFITKDKYDPYNKVQQCSTEDYDIMRTYVYQMLDDGKLVQYFDETTNSIRLKENEIN